MKKFLILIGIYLCCLCKKDNSSQIVRTLHVPEEISTIQEAINKAHDYDTILVLKGIYEENINFTGKRVYLTSYYYRTLDTLDIINTIIKGVHNSVVSFQSHEDSTSVIDGFTITNGNPLFFHDELIQWKGGGLFIKNASPSLRNLIVKGNYMFYPNTSGMGGGIYCDSGGIKAFNLIIKENACAAYYGAGIFARNSKVSIQNTKIFENYTYSGELAGGIQFMNVEFIIRDSKIEHNYNTISNYANIISESSGRFVNTIIYDSLKSYKSKLLFENCIVNGVKY